MGFEVRVWGARFSEDKFKYMRIKWKRAGNIKLKLGSSRGYVHGFVLFGLGFEFKGSGFGVTRLEGLFIAWGSGVGLRHRLLHAPCKFLGLGVRGSKQYSLRVKGVKGIRVNGSRT